MRRTSRGRRRTPARASRAISLTRLAAAAALLAASGAFYGVTAAEPFTLDSAGVEITGAVHTDQAAIRRLLGMTTEEIAQPNVFRVPTGRLEESLLTLPSVVDAQVSVVLPDRMIVRVEERRPILVWAGPVGDHLVDIDGLRFATAGAAEAGLPRVGDGRTAAVEPRLGDRIDPTDLGAARRLAAVTPPMLGSSASSLILEVSDREGWSLAASTGWRAIFGFYTPRGRSVDLIDGQVQCLRALLEDREPSVGLVYLSPEADRCGTYRERIGS